ncbi:site-specific DNA-methyltransferase [Apibacter mensalis]|uniref:site-specific DNA-methyltransferase n=1 Tax=Apibacter mensalis TaxID=1586267 RepID=UPI0026ECC055|nr:site-specific DNA-methyltransferase [Apibacter mensalis]
MPTLHWIGKEKVINHHQEVPFRILEKQYTYTNGTQTEEKEKTSENKIIHGDNLEALKSLLPEYEGKIKCIYIDPPYNTGNEGWVYNDNVNDPKIKKWLGQVVGKESEDLSRHDKWLCMMYPRLKLLHKLLANDGAIFISIDDNEQANLKLICDEIFGESNFICNLPRITKKAGKTSELISLNNDYLICYKKKDVKFNFYQHFDSEYKHIDKYEKERGKYKLSQTLDYGSIQYSKSLDYEIDIDGVKLRPGNVTKEEMIKRQNLNPKSDFCWRWSKELFEFGFKSGFIVLKKSKNAHRIYTKTYERASINKNNKKEYYIEFKERTKSATTLDFIDNKFSNDNSRKLIENIFGSKIFEYSKPSVLIEYLIYLSTQKNAIILDSFAGSGTTAHAVLNLNKQDGGNRKFILVEIEDYAESITAERVKRVISGYGEGNKAVEGTGGDFSYYELGKPLFLEENILNEEVGEDKIREYIWYSEVKIPYQKQEENYLLGKQYQTAYYFYYDKEKLTTLDENFLRTLKTKAEQYIIYADNCLLDADFMNKHSLIFKKIPRDITRF